MATASEAEPTTSEAAPTASAQNSNGLSSVQLVQACAYALKLAKRERPQVRPDWRMCPST